MNTQSPHPVELLLLAVVAVAWAAWTLARAVMVPAVALLLAATRRTSPAPAPVPAAAPVAVHPLAALADGVADTLTGATVAELRRRARSAGLPRAVTRNGRKAQLIEALAAWEVAACG